jgi:hypothetical protein
MAGSALPPDARCMVVEPSRDVNALPATGRAGARKLELEEAQRGLYFCAGDQA